MIVASSTRVSFFRSPRFPALGIAGTALVCAGILAVIMPDAFGRIPCHTSHRIAAVTVTGIFAGALISAFTTGGGAIFKLI